MTTPFSLKKSCAFDCTSSIHLEFTLSQLFLEVRKNGSVITRMDFPYSYSGLSFAKRIYNGLQ